MNYPYLDPRRAGLTRRASLPIVAGRLVRSTSRWMRARWLPWTTAISLQRVTLVSNSFRVKPGGEPQLSIDGVTLDTDKTMLTFYVSGVSAGRRMRLCQCHVDGRQCSLRLCLTVNVLGDDDCGCMRHALPTYPRGNVVSGDGSVIVNTAPRFFVSATAPVDPNVLDRWYNTTTGTIFMIMSAIGLETSWWEGGDGGGGGGGGGGAQHRQYAADRA